MPPTTKTASPLAHPIFSKQSSQNGATRKKLEASSGCIAQYIGYFALFAGTKEQRTKIKEYLKWLFEQLDGPVEIEGAEQREDLTQVDIPQESVGYITGRGGRRCWGGGKYDWVVGGGEG